MRKRSFDELTFSEESSVALLSRAQAGDAVAMEALMGHCLTRLQRWASGRVPARIRARLDSEDIVQDALLNTFRRIHHFQPHHDGALMAYLRQAASNCIRMELRRAAPQFTSGAELETLPCRSPSPLEFVLDSSARARYERALSALDEDDRAVIVSRFEMGLSYSEVARAMNRPTAEAARKAAERALRRLVELMPTQ